LIRFAQSLTGKKANRVIWQLCQGIWYLSLKKQLTMNEITSLYWQIKLKNAENVDICTDRENPDDYVSYSKEVNSTT